MTESKQDEWTKFDAAALANLEAMKRRWAIEDKKSRRRLFKQLAVTIPLAVACFIIGGGL